MSLVIILIIVSSGDEKEHDTREKSKAHFKATTLDQLESYLTTNEIRG